MSHQPPKWADRFLRWYCHPHFIEEIEGDIYELFDRRVEQQDPRVARIKFVWDVFRFLRWSNIKRSNSNYTTMNQFQLFRNYLKLGFRNIKHNPVSSSINIFGLAIAICFAISIYIFTDMTLHLDSFHEKGDRIYQLTNYVEQDGSTALWSDSPYLLGPKIVSDHPSVENFARIEYRSSSVKKGLDVFDELIIFTDPGFFEMFSFPMLNGTNQVLYDKNKVVISRNMAVKYFDNEDPVGQELSFKFTNGKILLLVVGAVLDEYPYNSSLTFDFYLPMENFEDLNFENTADWGFMTDATLVMLKEGESIGSLSSSYENYVALQQGSDPEWQITSFEPIGLYDIATESFRIDSSIIGGQHPAGRIAMIVITLCLLGMACFNFMNIAVVGAAKRLKEIALRKVMGSVRSEIVKQFLIENILQCFFALVIGLLLAYFALIPWFDYSIPDFDIEFRTVNPWNLIIFMVSLLVCVGLISGAYPAFYISKFDTITIFKGKEKFGSKNVFSKIMLGVQFFLAVMTIVGCFVMLDQSIHLKNKNWGYDPTGIMSIYVSNDEQYELLKNEVIQHPAVSQYTSADYLLGRGIAKSSLEHGNRKVVIRQIGVSENYFETFDLQMKEGRPMSDRVSDQQNGVVVNEKFVNAMGWEGSAVGQSFMYDSINRLVIGVVEDFHYYNFFAEVGPLMIHGLPKEKVHYLTMRAHPDQLAGLEAFTKSAWQKIAPNDPFDRVYQEEAFDGFYQENKSNISILVLITSIAVLLACLGLYGLLSFDVQGKLKEFSVRKVLGAEPSSLIRIVSKQYFWVLLIAFIIGAPLGTMGMLNLVNAVFPEPKPITAAPFIIAMLIILFTLVVTVAGQISRAIKVNPAELLRSE